MPFITVDELIANMESARFKTVDDDGSVHSEEGVHCPHCGNFEPSSSDFGVEMYREGEVPYQCPNCDADLRLEIGVSYSWTARAEGS